jgi:lipopolysaccharide/colanic/teichoic acid biosynthesis glycosyltransferase
MIPFYTYKSAVKPGLIGWSQVHAMPDECQDTLEALEYDLYYIKQMSVVLDAYIFLRALRGFFSNKPDKISARRPDHVRVG